MEKFSHTRFEPSGWTDNRKIGFAKSILDYIFRWLDAKFPEGRYEDQQMLPGFGAPQAMEETNDGFRIAELDLEIRGPGEHFGIGQSANPLFRVAEMRRDAEYRDLERR